MTFRTNVEDARIYTQRRTNGENVNYLLADQNMYDYFSACDGGTPEAPLVEWAIEQYAGHHAGLVDIGCHVGTWAIPFASEGIPVIAFEAQPWLGTLCRLSSILSGVESCVQVVKTALAQSENFVTLQAPYPDGGGGSIVRTWDDPALTFAVPTMALDSWHRGSYNRGISLIKIDVEGAELDVIKGAQGTIRAKRPDIIFECWNDELGQRREDLFRYLQDTLEYEFNPLFWPETYLATSK